MFFYHLIFKSLIFYIILQDYISTKFPKFDQITINRFISSIHAIYVVINSLIFFMGFHSHCAYEMTHPFSIGYLLYDILFSLYTYSIGVSKNKPTHIIWMFIHHLLLSICLVSCPIGLEWYVAFGLLCEISTPFLHMSWYNKENNLLHTTIGKCVSTCLITTFFVTRVLIFGYIQIMLPYEIPNEHIGYYYICMSVIFMSIIYGLNLYWFYNLVDMYLKNYIPVIRDSLIARHIFRSEFKMKKIK